MNKQEINQAIQKEIIANPNIETSVLVKKYKVTGMTVGANRSIVKRGLSAVNQVIENEVSVLDKVMSKYELAKKQGENTYANHNGINKEVARDKMANHIIDSGVIGEVPTLPNTTWAIEQKIVSGLKDMSFIGAECIEDTFIQMKAKLRSLKLNAKTFFGKIGDLMYGKIEDTYAHLILDYCGELPTISKEIEYAINNDIVKLGGIIAVTFAKPIRTVSLQSTKIKGLAAINNADNRCMSDKAVEAYFNKVTGWNYQVVEFFYYQDTYPMTLVIIKRIK
jgi:hypothetical protein